ncbi:YkuS family protein [Alicyclobacillus dauci]|uniref:YkuS family protein n=1 Tax=Alicyclobacillus dauci TaxID=1475485 RepID=A0ABY6Z4R3_9BACL|nr:YkuS family protein [Alicyclobacillus dauci]WAH37274.1 YkuS family protein [Alicyclobacillus dauci]
MKSVAVEEGLTPVKQYLEQQGCQVVDMRSDRQGQSGVCAVVITGADKNLMGIQTVVNNVPVISAEGLSPEDVYQRVKQFVQ